jgi:hypothetical protein
MDKKQLGSLAIAATRNCATNLLEDTIVAIEKWFQENPQEPIAVGLTTDQVQQLAHRLDTVEVEYIEGEGYVDIIYEFLAEQNFADSTAPSWNTAPKWATHRARDSYGEWRWFEKKPTRNSTGWFGRGGTVLPIQDKGWEDSLQERPKPRVKVEVGQIWKHIVGSQLDNFTVTETQR